MKKISGKVVSLVLALALVVTSFSTAAFAATKSATATITLDSGKTVALVNGDTDKTLDLFAWFNGFTAKDVEGHPISGLQLRDIVVTGGSAYASIIDRGTAKADDGLGNTVTAAKLKLTDSSVTGTVTLAARYAGKVTDGNNDTTIYNGTATLTGTILQNGSIVISPSTVPADGKLADSLGTLPKFPADNSVKVTAVVSTVGPTGTLAAGYTTVTILDKTDSLDKTTASKTEYVATVTATGVKSELKANGVIELSVNAPTASGAVYGQVGTISIKVQKYMTNANPDTTNGSVYTPVIQNTRYGSAVASTKVANRVEARTGDKAIYAWGGGTFLASTAAAAGTANTAGALNVTGSDVVLKEDTTMSGGSVGTISGAHNFSITNGAVAAIADGVTKTTISNKANVTKVGTDGTGPVTISGGVVGAVVSTGAVIVNADDAKIPTKVGDITAPAVNIGSSDNKATITTGKIKSSVGMGGTFALTITGNSVSVPSVDVNYADTVNISYVNYKGVGHVPANVCSQTTGWNYSIDADSVVTFAGAVSMPNISNLNGTVEFQGKTTLGGASGTGTLVFVPGQLHFSGNVTGVALKSSKEFKVGDTLFTADAFTVYEGSFINVGYVPELVAVNDKVNAFKVKSVEFYGIVLNKTSDTLVKGNSATYTASAYPAGTKIPEGYTVKIDFSGDSNYFEFKDNENGTATVKAVEFEKTFPSLNNGVVSAKLYDSYGYVQDAYKAAECNVTIVEKPAYTIDTQNLQLKVGNTYQYKITTSDGVAPTVTIGTGGVVTLVQSGADTANKAFYFKVTPVAGVKVGTQVGLYVNGVKADVITITAGDTYKLDTTKVTVAKGATYQVKCTSASAPTVVAGSSSFSVSAVTKVGNDFFFKVTPTANAKSGDVCGFYINGEKTPAMTATVK